jgi:hypothetical protein
MGDPGSGTSAVDGQTDGGALYNLAFGNSITDGSAVFSGGRGPTEGIYNSILADSYGLNPLIPGGASLASNVINGTHFNQAEIAGRANLVDSFDNINFTTSLLPSYSSVITISGVSPDLGPLHNNGGPTSTMAVGVFGPAFGKGVKSANTPATDQRGLPRLDAGRLDLGAYELQLSRIFVLAARDGKSKSKGMARGPDSHIWTVDSTANKIAGHPSRILLKTRVTDISGKPVAGATVTFREADGSTGAGGLFAGGSTTASASTNAHGVAVAPLLTATHIAGRYTVTEYVGDLSMTFMFRSAARAPAVVSVHGRDSHLRRNHGLFSSRPWRTSQ